MEVNLDEDLLAQARLEVQAAASVIAEVKPPAPLEDDLRCLRCGHASVCLPDEHWQRQRARRIGVADPTGRILHLASAGSRASPRRGRIEVSVRGEEPTRVPLAQVAGLVVHGNADVSSALVREMLARGYPVVWRSWFGRVIGWACTADGPNGDARGRQHRLASERRAEVAAAIVAAKLRNQAALLRRHDRPERVALRVLAHQAQAERHIGALLGIEGRGTRLYVGGLAATLRPPWARLTGRHGRPARDQVNAALNIAYGLLLPDVIRSVVACGLDPADGVLHSAGRNKPALALDLMEELRAPVADSAVLWAFNNGELREQDFRSELDVVRLTERGRKAVIAADERRVGSELHHPMFGYKVTWRRAMDVQARMFLAMVLGELTYRPIEIR